MKPSSVLHILQMCLGSSAWQSVALVRQRSRVQIPAKAIFHAQYLNELGTKNWMVQFTLIPFLCVETPWSTNKVKKLLSTFITLIAELITTPHTASCRMSNVTNMSLQKMMREPCLNYKRSHVGRSLSKKIHISVYFGFDQMNNITRTLTTSCQHYRIMHVLYVPFNPK